MWQLRLLTAFQHTLCNQCTVVSLSCYQLADDNLVPTRCKQTWDWYFCLVWDKVVTVIVSSAGRMKQIREPIVAPVIDNMNSTATDTQLQTDTSSRYTATLICHSNVTDSNPHLSQQCYRQQPSSVTALLQTATHFTLFHTIPYCHINSNAPSRA